MKTIFRTTSLAFLFACAVVLGYGYMRITQEQRLRSELETLNAQLEAQRAVQQAMLDRLRRTRRLAHVTITEQESNDKGDVTNTSFEFIELDDQGSELARQSFTIPGDVLFIDAWTVKFDHERVAQGHPLMGRTLVLLRRVYSDKMSPQDGYEIDTPGAIPPGYATEEPGHFEQKIWQSFWNFATDAAMAKEIGIRVAQGEAVYKPVKTGQTFELVVDAVGGMSLIPLSNEAVTLGSD